MDQVGINLFQFLNSLLNTFLYKILNSLIYLFFVQLEQNLYIFNFSTFFTFWADHYKLYVTCRGNSIIIFK